MQVNRHLVGSSRVGSGAVGKESYAGYRFLFWLPHGVAQSVPGGPAHLAGMTLIDHSHDDGIVLCDDCDGRWLLVTESGSTYSLCLDDPQTLTRIPDADAVLTWLEAGGRIPERHEIVLDHGRGRVDRALAARGEMGGSVLRGDGETLPLLAIGQVRIGRRVAIAVDVLGRADVVTTRLTTPVVRVVRLEATAGE